MADIQYNGQSLELSPGVAVVVERFSSFFDSDLRNDLTLPLTLPYEESPRNRKILRDLDIVQAIITTQRLEVLFEYAGRYYLSEMVLRSLEGGLQVNLYFDKVDLKVLNKRLPELSIPNSKNFAQAYDDGISQAYPQTKVFFPAIYWPEFYDPIGTDSASAENPYFMQVVNVYDPINDQLLPNRMNGPTAENLNVAVPMPSVLAILEAGFAEDGFILEGSFLQNPAMQRAFLLNNRAIDKRDNQTIYQEAEASVARLNFVQPQWPAYDVNFSSTSAAFTQSKYYNCQEAGTFEAQYRLFFRGSGSFDIRLVQIDTLGNVTELGKRFYSLDQSLAGREERMLLKVPFEVSSSDNTLGGTIALRVVLIDRIQRQPVEVQLRDVSLKIRLTSYPLMEFEAPDDWGPYCPDIGFGDLFQALLKDYQLEYSIDRANRRIKLNYREQVLLTPERQDWTSFVMGPPKVEFEDQGASLLRYDPATPITRDRPNTLYRRMILFDEQGNYERVEQVPENFDGQEIILGNHPLLIQRTATAALPSGGIISHLAEGAGRSVVYGEDKDPIRRLHLGYAVNDANGYPVGANDYQGSEALSLDFDQDSIAQRWLRWLRFRKKDHRFFNYRFSLPRPWLDQLNLSLPLVVQDAPFVIDSLRAEAGEGDYVSVVLRMRRV